jgi:hypothetical protein
MWMAGGFAITSKCEHIGQLSLGFHLLQFLFQLLGNLLASGHGFLGTVVLIEAAFTIDAVEGTNLAVGR